MLPLAFGTKACSAGDVPKVQLSLSSDEGRTVLRPVRIDSGNPLGRPAITAFDNSTYLVTWLEKTTNGNSEIRIRLVSHHGVASAAYTVTQAPLGRGSGFPKVVVSGENIFLAWRDERLRVALLSKSQFLQSQTKDKK